jgi:glycosyltransferase involved in cell wall biosynthesis
MNISVVIPTYNSGSKLALTLDTLVRSDTSDLDGVEVIVVDDGSPVPATPIVEARAVTAPFSLRLIAQQNAGPASARNAGFRVARGEVVLFMDDDILAPPELLGQHVRAHRVRPGTVIYGRCPFVEPQPSTALFRCLDVFGWDPAELSAEEFVRTDLVASGQLSVERSMFQIEGAVYCDDLATPAAEEFELSLRLQERGIPILLATRVIAMHNHPVVIDSICRQQFKHAAGYAEVAVKSLGALSLPQVRDAIANNQPVTRSDSFGRILRKGAKSILAAERTRTVFLRFVELIERAAPEDRLLAPLYNLVVSLYFFAGVRDGLRRYSGTGSCLQV